MKRIAACLALAAATAGAALPAAAQGSHSIWVKGGWDDPSPSASASGYGLDGAGGKGGFAGGLAWEATIGKRWSLEAEVLWVRRTAAVDYSRIFPGETARVSWEMTTLEVPFHAKYHLGNGRTRPYLLGGWVTAIPLTVEQQGTPYGEDTVANDKYEFRKVWLALEAGAGLEQSLGGNLGLGVDVRYAWGLNDVRDTASKESLKMRDLRVVAGLKIGL